MSKRIRVSILWLQWHILGSHLCFFVRRGVDCGWMLQGPATSNWNLRLHRNFRDTCSCKRRIVAVVLARLSGSRFPIMLRWVLLLSTSCNSFAREKIPLLVFSYAPEVEGITSSTCLLILRYTQGIEIGDASSTASLEEEQHCLSAVRCLMDLGVAWPFVLPSCFSKLLRPSFPSVLFFSNARFFSNVAHPPLPVASDAARCATVQNMMQWRPTFHRHSLGIVFSVTLLGFGMAYAVAMSRSGALAIRRRWFNHARQWGKNVWQLP